jgi:hypothetical protein
VPSARVRCRNVDSDPGLGDNHRALSLASRKPDAMVCAFWLGLVALPALPAQAAEPQPPGLNWVRLSGAQSCISAAELAQRVEARVGRVLFAATSEAGVFVDGHVRPGPGQQGWEVTLELSEPHGKVLGRREIQFASGDCSVIDEAVALVIAVTLYPNTGLLDAGIPLDPSTAASLRALFGREPVDPDPASLPLAAATPSPADASEQRDRPANALDPRADAAPARHAAPATRSATWSYGLDAAASGGFGHLPGLTPGVAAHVTITPPSAWTIEAGLVFFPARTERHARASGRVRFELLAASLALCPWQPAWLRELAVCAGAEVGRLQVASRGFVGGDMTANDAVASVMGTARLHLRIGGALHLRAALVVAVPLAQHRYTVETDDGSPATLFRIPQLTARAELGPALAF